MATSYNGWTASRDPDELDIDKAFTAAGRKFPGGVKRGPVSVVLRYVIEQFNKRVEPVDLYDPGDEWGYVYKQSANASSLVSCHSSGTAVDINATRHPNGTPAAKTFTADQIKTIKAILVEVDGTVRWLGEAKTPDPMHFEISGDEAAVARVAGRLLSTVPPPPEDDMFTDADRELLARINDKTEHNRWNRDLLDSIAAAIAKIGDGDGASATAILDELAARLEN